MRIGQWLLGAGAVCWAGMAAGVARGQVGSGVGETDQAFARPLNLSLQPEPESVYAPPAPPREDEGLNEGGVHFDLSVGYYTDYVYRGVEVFEPPGAEDRANLQVNAKLSFDLGKLPHPFIAVFVNIADSDPISTFQEIRPNFGVDWTIRPLILSAGHNTYLYPDRDDFETSDIWGQIKLDDSYFLHTDRPVLSPYVYGAYDYDRYNGWYLEAGISHDFVIEDTGLTITALANIAYVRGMDLYAVRPDQHDINGFQHYQLGLVGTYSLNQLLNFSRRYGEWSLEGFVYYNDNLDNDLAGTTQLWGGMGIALHY